MNDAAIRNALAKLNLIQVSEATRIAPHILQRIAEGTHLPDPDQIDALAGWFQGEYFMSGTDFNWKRNKKQAGPVETLSTISATIDPATLPPRQFGRWASPADYPALPALNAGPKPSGTGAIGDGITGTGQKVVRP